MDRTALLVALLLPYPLFASENTIEIDGGQITGTIAGGVRAFKGIPYAAPPVGQRRWQPPQPVIPWDGIRDCSTYGKACPQTPYPSGSIYHLAPEPQSEDCLFLNVWAPKNSGNEPLPVMVWIHGGAWTRGSGSVFLYDGSALARRGVVVVTINYRLGAFGFFAHPEVSAESDHGVSGNQGILDQIAALQWVRRNISQFGGDAGRVTVFGESAGSWSVHALMATPLAKGLFHRAIGQSGSRFGGIPLLAKARGEEKSAHDEGLAFARQMNVDNLAALREVPAEQILKAKFSTHHTIDGHVFPASFAELFASGSYNQVPVIVGSNADEMTSLSNPFTQPKTIEAVKATLGRNMPEEGIAGFLKVYNVTDDASAASAFLQIGADTAFALGMRQWARFADSHGTASWLYYFTHSPPGPYRDILKAYHAAEIAYVFDNSRPNDRTPYDETDTELAQQMSQYWINFATTGNPNGPGLVVWPEYTTEAEGYLDISPNIKAGQHLLKARLDFLEAAAGR